MVLNAETLDYWGEKCLSRKKAGMANLLKIASPDEAIYREIMLALGYKNSKVQFLELATITPYSEIKRLKDQALISKILLYRAGFSENKDEFPEDFDFSLKMDESIWNYKDIRPANFPEKRIKNISVFFAESCHAGGLERIFRNRIVENYETPLSKHNATKIAQIISFINGIGKQRGLEILFNIILPIYMVQFEEENQKKYIDFINGLYCFHPTLEDNSITKMAKTKFFDNQKTAVSNIKSVKQYMGLIEFYNQEISGVKEDDT